MGQLSTELSGPFVVLEGPERVNVSRETFVYDYEMPMLFGLEPSPALLWYRKKERQAFDPEPKDYVTTALEDVCAALFSYRTGRPVARDRVALWSTAYPELAALVDHWYQGTDGKWRPLLVVISSSVETWPDDPHEIENPVRAAVGAPCLELQLRAAAQLLVTGAEQCALSVLCGPGFERHRYAEYDEGEALTDLVVDATNDFIDTIESGEPPQADGSKATRSALLAMARKTEEIVLTDEQCEDVLRYEEAKAQREKYEAEEALYKNRFLQMFGSASRAIFPSGNNGYALVKKKRRGYSVTPKQVTILTQIGSKNFRKR